MATYADRTRLAEMHRANLVDRSTCPPPGAEDAQCMALKYNLDKTPTSSLFFSKTNIDALQNEIVLRVNKITKKTICRQSEYELLLIMRGVYLRYSNNNPAAVVDEVRWLNGIVLGYVVPNVVAHMAEYIRYINEVGKNPMPIDHPQMTSLAGTRSRPLQNPGV